MSVQMFTLRCKNVECLLELRVGRYLRNPPIQTGVLEHCPMCGGIAETRTEETEDYWEVLAEAYGLPVEGLQAIYGIWNPKEQPNFKKFVDEMLVEAGVK